MALTTAVKGWIEYPFRLLLQEQEGKGAIGVGWGCNPADCNHCWVRGYCRTFSETSHSNSWAKVVGNVISFDSCKNYLQEECVTNIFLA